ncbi:hypothetical protein NCC49_006015 [Naganishia albida]|nr:hypothetical protein NCC49_006015 [Naganishia albida]
MKSFHQMLLEFCPERFVIDADERLKWVNAWQVIDLRLQQGRIKHGGEILESILSVSENQRRIAQTMLRVESSAEERMEELNETMDALEIGHRGEESTVEIPSASFTEKRKDRDDEIDSKQFVDSPPTSTHTSYYPADEADNHLRDWFLAHLAYPFPDKPTKAVLCATTGLDVRQLNTWFTNMRRRSGWTDHSRSYARGNKQRFGKMCTDALAGRGDEALRRILAEIKDYAAKKRRGKVGDWLLNVSLIVLFMIIADVVLQIIEEGTAADEPRAAKKPRLGVPTKKRQDDIRHTLPEYTLAPPRAPEDDSEQAAPPIDQDAEEDETSRPPVSQKPCNDSTSTPITPLEPKNSKSRKVKSYDFSIGRSDETPRTPSRRRPTATCRPSPLRTVSTASSSSVQAVDQVLRSVSGSSSTSTISNNVSSDLNFSFPVYTQTASPVSTMPAQLPPPMPFPNLLPFGTPEMSTYGFNPSLPQSLAMPFYPSMSCHPSALYPPIQLNPTAVYQQFHAPTYPVSEMRFTENFGTVKRGIEEVAGIGQGRLWKVPRMGGV